MSPPRPPRPADAQRHTKDASSSRHATSFTTVRRRTALLSVSPLPLLLAAPQQNPLVNSLTTELSLWQQELDYYRRQLPIGKASNTNAKRSAAGADQSDAFRLDPNLSAFLLSLPLASIEGPPPPQQQQQQQQQQQESDSSTSSIISSSSSSSSSGSSGQPSGDAAGVLLPRWSRRRFEADFAALLKQELPYARQSGICGSCGDTDSSSSGAGKTTSSSSSSSSSISSGSFRKAPGQTFDSLFQGDLTDSDWVGFLSYVSWKALARQLPPGPRAVAGAASVASGLGMLHSATPEAAAAFAGGGGGGGDGTLFGTSSSSSSSSSGEAGAARGEQQQQEQEQEPPPAAAALRQLRARVGEGIVAYAAADLEATGGAAADAAALQSESASLDSIRAAVRALLRYYTSQGLVVSAGIEQAGLSLDEFENQQVWMLGEPAFLKVWVRSPATALADDALFAEEGFSPDLLASGLEGALRRCGVETEAFKRYPSYSEPDLVAFQWTLRRVRALTAAEAAATEPSPFSLDPCPGSEGEACY